MTEEDIKKIKEKIKQKIASAEDILGLIKEYNLSLSLLTQKLKDIKELKDIRTNK